MGVQPGCPGTTLGHLIACRFGVAKINLKVPQLLCIVVSGALNGEFERFGGFCGDCNYTL